jgi:hypothetical protein
MQSNIHGIAVVIAFALLTARICMASQEGACSIDLSADALATDDPAVTRDLEFTPGTCWQVDSYSEAGRGFVPFQEFDMKALKALASRGLRGLRDVEQDDIYVVCSTRVLAVSKDGIVLIPAAPEQWVATSSNREVSEALVLFNGDSYEANVRKEKTFFDLSEGRPLYLAAVFALSPGLESIDKIVFPAAVQQRTGSQSELQVTCAALTLDR